MYMYIHVHVVMYLYVHGINMSVPCSDTYVPFCPILSRWVGFQMNRVFSTYWYVLVRTRYILVQERYISTDRYTPVRTEYVPEY